MRRFQFCNAVGEGLGFEIERAQRQGVRLNAHLERA